MPENTESTMKWKVDITEFTRAMREAKRYISMANAEFKESTASMDRWSNSSDGLDAKLKQLKKTLEGQERVLEVQKKSYSEMSEEQQKNTAAGQQLAIQIKNQEADIKKTKAQIDKYNDSLDKLRQEEKASETALSKLNDTIEEQQDRVDALKKEYQNAVVQYGKTSKEARSLAKELQSVSGELADNKNKLKEADDAADDFDRSLKDAADTATESANGGFTVLKGAFANLVSQGISRATQAIKDFASTMINEAATVRAETSQFEQTFGDMGDEAEAAIKRVAESTGILDTRLKVVGSQIYAFARSSGATVPEAMQLMETALMASADSAAYYDKSLADSAETLQSFLKGNYANDAALGVSATEFTRNAKATELFGKKYNELTEIQKQQTLLKMVTDSQKLSGAMGQAAREADGWENVQGNLNEAWRQFKANVGTPFLEQLIPVIQKVTRSFQDWMQKVNWRKFNQTVKDTTDTIKKGFKWVLDNRKPILDTLKSIAVAFVTYKAVATITSVIGAFNKFYTAVKAGNTIMQALNMTMKANPYALLLGGVAALVTVTFNYAKRAEEARKAQYGLNEAEQEAIDKVAELTDQYNELNEARQSQMSDVNAEFGYIKELKDEYNGLIGSNGKVKEGYEDRAKFILTTLAEAMGMELDDIQKLIDKNGQLGDSIDKVIEKKQAEALLAANEDMYNQAIKERASALTELADAQKVVEDAEKDYKEAQEESKKVMDEFNRLVGDGRLEAAAKYYVANQGIILGEHEAKKAFEDATKEVKDAENAWINYNGIIQNYEGLAAAIISGDADKINEAMANMTYNFLTAETGNRESLERQVENYKTNLQNLQDAIDAGTPNVTQKMVDQAKAMVDAAEAELDKLPPEASATGDKAGTDFANSMGGKKDLVASKTKELSDQADISITPTIQKLTDAGSESGKGFGNSVGSQANKTNAKSKAEALADEAVKGASSENGEEGGAKKSGSNFGEGFFNGIGSWLTSVWERGKALAKKALAGLKAGQEEGSPSKLTRKSGVFFGQGYELGIASMVDPVRSAASDLAKQAVNALGANISDQMHTIGVDGGQSLIDGMNSIVPNMSASIGDLKASVASATASMSGQNKANVGTFTSNDGGNQQTIVFNQNITSPKAVDRLSVYRDTNSLLFSAKVRMGNV